MANFMVILYEDNVAIEKHIIHTPRGDEKGFYRQGVSFSYFKTRESTIHYNAYTKGKIVKGYRSYVQWLDDYLIHEQVSKDAFEKLGIPYKSLYDGLPEYEHFSVWDFYNQVGYDYKKKKYIKVEEK